MGTYALLILQSNSLAIFKTLLSSLKVYFIRCPAVIYKNIFLLIKYYIINFTITFVIKDLTMVCMFHLERIKFIFCV